MGNGVTSIGRNAFRGSSQLASVTFSPNLSSIGSYAFCDCPSLASLSLPSSLRTISDRVFLNCSGLTTLVIPEGVETIGGNAFEGMTGLESAHLPSSIVTFGSYIFYGSVGTLYVKCNIPDAEWYGSPFAESKFSSVVIESGVESIGSCAFRGCSTIQTVQFPGSLTNIGVDAFNGCSGLTEVSCMAMTPPTLGANVFANINLSNVTLTVPKLSIDAYATADQWRDFGNISGQDADPATSVALNITSAELCVEEQILLEATVLPVTSSPEVTWTSSNENVATVNTNGLVTATGAGQATISATTTDGTDLSATCKVTVLDCLLKGSCGDDMQYELSVDGTLQFEGNGQIPSYDVAEQPWADFRDRIQEIDIAEGVTGIGDKAFFGCTGVTTLTLPKSLLDVGSQAFDGCRLRTAVAKSPTPRNYQSAFSTQTSIHSPLYVPQGTRDQYIYNTEWGTFHNVKEYAVSAVQEQQAYMLADVSGMHFAVYNAGKGVLEIKDYLHEVDETDNGSCWISDRVGTGITLRNIAANRYADVDADGHVLLSDNPVVLTLSFNDGTALINGHRMMMVLCESEPQIYAASIALDRTSAALTPGAKEQLTATVLPEDATDKTVTWTSSDPAVATVDENGLVTAVAAGAATITATTNDGTNLTATCEVTVETPISNYLTLTDVSGLIGARCVLPISMSNTESIKGLQFDLRLPDGVTVATNEYDEMMFTLTSRAHSSHTVSANRLGNGDYRVVVSSLSAKTFSGTEGVIMNVTLSVDNNQVAGDYDVKLFSIVLNTADNVSIKPNDVTATLSLSDVAPGDVNGDGSINVTDVGMVIDHILEHTPAGFIAEAADINGDGDINVTDVGLIIDIILSDNSAREVLMTENVKKSVEEIHEPQ